MKNWKPFFIENSRVPVWLSKFAPIEIGAISLAGFVFSRTLMSDLTKRHETIHFQQQLELLFVPFFILYLFYWLKGLMKHGPQRSYLESPFEKEAYNHEHEVDYLSNRKRFAWLKYI